MSLRIALLAVALMSPVADDEDASDEPDPEAASETSSETPVQTPLRVGDTLLRAAKGECVVLTVDPNGATRVGRLEEFGDDIAVLGQASGLIVQVDRREIHEVRFAVGHEQSQCRPLPPPAAVIMTPAPGACADDDACEDPRVCIEGKCQLEASYVDALEAEGHARRKAGRRMLIAGPSVLAAGLILLPIGIVVERNGYDALSAEECWNRPSDTGVCDEARKRLERGTATWAVGTAFIVAGVATTTLGAIFFGLGKSKLERSAAYRRELSTTIGPGSFGLRGRF
jgi:hypothetical protein